MLQLVDYQLNFITVSQEEDEKQSAFRKALKSFNDRLGVDYMELSKNVEAQKIARRNLDKETLRLRMKYMNQTDDEE